MPACRDIGQKDAHLAVSDFAERTTVLWRNTNGVLALLGKATLIDDEDAIGSRETRRKILLKGVDDWSSGPGSLRQKALERTWRRARDGFGKVLSVATIGVL